MKITLPIISILLSLQCFSQCEDIIDTLIVKCDVVYLGLNNGIDLTDITSLNALNDKLDFLKKKNCIIGLSPTILNSFQKKTQSILNIANTAIKLKKSAYNAEEREYYQQAQIYQNSLLNFRLHLQMLLEEKVYTDSLNNKFKKIDLLRDSIDTVLVLLRTKAKTLNDTLKIIDSFIFNKIDSVLLKSFDSTTIHQTDSIIKVKDSLLQIKTSSEMHTTDSLLKNCCKDNYTFLKNILSMLGYQNSLYGIAYYRNFKNRFALGTEMVFPISSTAINNAGFFVSGGIAKNNLLFQIGLGWLKTALPYDISWKSGITYFPSEHLGFGAAYSPLTGFGAAINFRFK